MHTFMSQKGLRVIAEGDYYLKGISGLFFMLYFSKIPWLVRGIG